MSTPRKVIDRIRRVCLSFPEAEEKPFGGHTSPAFRVRDKLFVMVSEDRSSLTCKAPKGVQQILVGSNPAEFFVPRYVGTKGWVGVSLGAVGDWDEIDELIEESYRMTAPKRLVAVLDGRRGAT